MGADQFDNLSADMFDEFDIDMGDDNSNKKKGSETLQNVSELLKSTGKGALKGLHNELKDRFGNTSQLVDETIATVDDFKKLQQDLASEISPAVNSMKQITLRSMPMVEKIMPKKWYDSIKKKLEEHHPCGEEEIWKRRSAMKPYALRYSLSSKDRLKYRSR